MKGKGGVYLGSISDPDIESCESKRGGYLGIISDHDPDLESCEREGGDTWVVYLIS